MSAELRRAWDQRVERGLTHLPRWLCRTIAWLRVPSHWWVRWLAALLLIAGGFAGFLPVLGFWMLPLGLALLAEDVPGIKSPLERLSRRLAGIWHRLRGH
jgi:hypothetical protein